MKEYFRIIVNIIFPFLAIVVLVVVGWNLVVFFMPFVIAWIIAMIANPLIHLLERKAKIVRKHSSMVLVIAVLAGIIAVLYLGISWIIQECIYFIHDWPTLMVNIQEEFGQIMLRIEPLFERLPDTMQVKINETLADLGGLLSQLISQISIPTIEVAGDVVSRIPTMLINFIITILSSYFFLADRERISAAFHRWVPKEINRYLDMMKKKINTLISGYFMAQFRIMFIVFLILTVGLGILGVSYYGLVAFLVSFLDMLPLFGTGTVLLPWAAIKLLAGEYYVAAGMVILYLITQGVRQIIQPKIVGDSLGLNPLATLFFMYLGLKFRGIAGMIIAVPVGLVAIELYRLGVFDYSIENMKLLGKKLHNFMYKREKNE